MPAPAHQEARRVAKLLEKKIQESDFSIRTVEERAGWSQATLNQVLSGRTPIRISHVAAVCAVLDMPLTDFYRELAGDEPITQLRLASGNQRAAGLSNDQVLEAVRKLIEGAGLMKAEEAVDEPSASEDHAEVTPWAQLAKVSIPFGQGQGRRERCEALLEHSWALRYSDPEMMVLTAEFAVTLAERFDTAATDAKALLDLQARAWAELGNARRVAGDLMGAEAALGLALERAERGTGDSLLLARLMDLTASLYIDQRRLDDARQLLDFAFAIYLQEGDEHSAGRALISKGIASSYAFDVEAVIHPLVQGLTLLDPAREPKLVLVAIHNLIWYLIENGQTAQAELLFQQCQPLYARYTERLDRAKVRWLEGRIAAAQGDDEHAEQRFHEARNRFEAAGLHYDMALVSLDLAVLWLRAGRTLEIREAVQETIAIFENHGIGREAVSMLIVLREALRKDQLTEALLHRIAAQLLRVDEPAVWSQSGRY